MRISRISVPFRLSSILDETRNTAVPFRSGVPYFIYEVPRDAHADLLLLFLKLDALNDRREVHLVNLIKSFYLR